MAVYFLYRCGYLGPTCRHLRRFEDATVLDWFRNHWRPFTDYRASYTYLEELLGTNVYSIGDLFSDHAEPEQPRPETLEDVRVAVSRTYHNAICIEEHCVQVLTDDDETDMAFYFFDDVFLLKHADLAAYVLREDWRLPDGEGEEGWTTNETSQPNLPDTRGEGPGCLYLVQIDLPGGHHLSDGFGIQHLQGCRVADLCQFVLSQPAEKLEDNCYYFAQLRDVLLTRDLAESDEERAFLKALEENPNDEVTWKVYADWTQDRGLRLPGLRLLERALPHIGVGEPERNLVQVGDHVIQLFDHTGSDEYDHWYVFDDLWGSAHPALANALLRYTRWDMLSTGNETREE